MKEITKSRLTKAMAELNRNVRETSLNLSKNRISLTLGTQKKTHLLKTDRREIARLQTLITQKKFLEKI